MKIMSDRVRVRIDYSDGRYSMTGDPNHEWPDEECVEIGPGTWRGYEKFLKEDAEWQNLIQMLDNSREEHHESAKS